MKLSVNLVSWNGMKYIKDCLKSLEQQTFTDFSLLVVDNGSTDGTLEFIKEEYPHVKVVEHKKNAGFARAHNQAIHWTKSPYILILNQDIILDQNCFEELIKFMDEHEKAGAVTPKLLRLQEGEKTNYIDSLGLKINKKFQVQDIAQGELDSGQYESREEVFGCSGACPIYRRSALVDVRFENEFFDEDFFSYKEDIDLSFRLQAKGWQNWVVPQAVAYHARGVGAEKGSRSLFQLFKHRRAKGVFANYFSYRNHLYFLNKNCVQWKFLPQIFLYEFGKFLYTLFLDPKNLRALVDVWKKRKRMKSKRKFMKHALETSKQNMLKWFE